MFTELYPAMRAHAQRVLPQESCGMVLKGAHGAEYAPCDNIAADPRISFNIADEMLLAALKNNIVLAIVHSHPAPHDAAPSACDMRSQIAMDVPWAIVPVASTGEAANPFWWGSTVPMLPLLDREYRHGVTDCYALVRDWYKQERGIHLRDYPREFEWWNAPSQPDLYRHNVAKWGFVEVDMSEAQTGDVLLMQIRSRVINHAAVQCEPGILIHHLGSQSAYDPSVRSSRENAARWMPFVKKVVRYKEAL